MEENLENLHHVNGVCGRWRGAEKGGIVCVMHILGDSF